MHRLTWLVGAWFLLIILPGGSGAQSAQESQPVIHSGLTTGSRIYLPVITNAVDIAPNQPIWP